MCMNLCAYMHMYVCVCIYIYIYAYVVVCNRLRTNEFMSLIMLCIFTDVHMHVSQRENNVYYAS